MRKILLLILVVSFCTVVLGQDNNIPDSARIDVRYFSQDLVKNYTADGDFRYENILEPQESIWSQFWDWVWSKIGRIISNPVGQFAFTRLLILLAAAILIFFILKITGMSKQGLFGKKNITDSTLYEVYEENIHSLNFDEIIAQAVAAKNYRLAVRMLYLHTLKLLSDRSLINWQPSKTNFAYVKELEGTHQHQPFAGLTWQFESNWYGNLSVTETDFTEVRNQFENFKRQL